MYKNIIILGSRRSGKSTLARMISNKYGYSLINIDNIIDTFEEIFPKNDDDENYDEYITNFINEYIKRLSSDSNFYNDKKYVIEGNVPNVEKIISNLDMEKNTVIGLVYNEITQDQFFENMRKFDSPYDWTRYLSDELLQDKIKEYLDENDKISNSFDECSISKFDVSDKRELTFDIILDAIEEYAKFGSLVYSKKIYDKD